MRVAESASRENSHAKMLGRPVGVRMFLKVDQRQQFVLSVRQTVPHTWCGDSEGTVTDRGCQWGLQRLHHGTIDCPTQRTEWHRIFTGSVGGKDGKATEIGEKDFVFSYQSRANDWLKWVICENSKTQRVTSHRQLEYGSIIKTVIICSLLFQQQLSAIFAGLTSALCVMMLTIHYSISVTASDIWWMNKNYERTEYQICNSK